MEGISIIITVYNLEQYIEKCLLSVTNQKYEKVEIIIIDDGSSDGSYELCKRFADKKDNIKLYRIDNGGRVKAREYGIHNAQYDYIAFVDGDDWIHPNIYACLMQYITDFDADLVVSGYVEAYDCKEVIRHNPIEAGLYKDEKLNYYINNWLFFNNRDEFGVDVSLWNKIYKKCIIEELFSVIPSNLYRGEDLLLNGLYLSKCKSIYVVDEAFYYYRQTMTSTVYRKCPDLYIQIGYIEQIMKEYYSDKPDIISEITMRNFLNFIRLWNYEHESNYMHVPYYSLDYSWIDNKPFVLYGAGKVGRDYYWFIKRSNPGLLKCWIDKNPKASIENGYDVYGIDRLLEFHEELVLIAIDSEEIAEDIKKELIKKYSFNPGRIIWHKPNHCWI